MCRAAALDADVGVYGSTVCGVAACVAVARMNRSCVLVEPSAHLFGMTSGGLSSVDLRMALGGIALEIFGPLPFPHFEPHVLNATLTALIATAGPGSLQVVARAGPLVGVDRSGGRLTQLTFDGGSTLRATTFLDCSYEGDLLVLSNTSFAVGREAAAEYNESFGGVAGNAPWASWAMRGLSPWVNSSNTTLLTLVEHLPPAPPGAGDDLVMSMNYRLCLTNNASNRLPFAPPPGYRASDMELLRRWWLARGGPQANLTLQQLFLWEPLPGAKADVNQGPMPMGADIPGLQRGFPLGTAPQRAALAAAHEWWTRAVWEFLRTDAAVPPAVRAEAASWGLPCDEWPGTAGFPPQLYVREGVRMRGAVVLTQRDVYGNVTGRAPGASSVGLSQWCVDVHVEQRVAVPPALTGRGWEAADAGGVNTCSGSVWQLTEVPYAALTPRREETQNLLVPVCASLTHVAFATYRLEPQYAVFGHSAGVAAVLALQAGVAVQDVDPDALQAALRAQGQLLDAEPPPAPGALALAPCVPPGSGGNATRQAWLYAPGDGSVRLAGGGGALCASVFGYSNATGARVVAASCHTGDPAQPHNQAFDVVVEEAEGGGAAAGGGGAAAAVAVRSRMSGLCVAVAAPRGAGSEAAQAACGSPDAAWQAPPTAPASGQWVAYDTGLCMTLQQ